MAQTGQVIDRREAIKRVSAMLGGVAFVGGTALAEACERPQSRAACITRVVSDLTQIPPGRVIPVASTRL